MDDMDINDEFRSIVMNDVAREVGDTIDQLVDLTSQARHAMLCNRDGELASALSQQAFELWASTSFKLTPTLVMNLADTVCVERERLGAVIDSIRVANTELTDGNILTAGTILDDLIREFDGGEHE